MIMCLLVIVVISTKPRHRTGPLVKLVITLACHAGIRSSSLLRTANLGVAQSGSASALGAEGRRFESYHRDQKERLDKIEKERESYFDYWTFK